MNTLLSILAFVVMLSIIISIHEFGHFIMAKAFHVYVFEFSIGMGPKLWQKKKGETRYTLRAIPMGGYCAMAGEDEGANIQDADGTEVQVPEERTLGHLPWYKQILVMLAGPAMNCLLAIVLFIGIYASIGYKVIQPEPVISTVLSGSPAEQAGLQSGDRILSITYSDGTVLEPETFYDVVEENLYHHDEAVYTILREGETLTFRIMPEYSEENQSYLIGITAPEATTEKLTGWGVIQTANEYFVDNMTLILKVLKRLARGQGFENLSGPIGIYSATAQNIQYGFISWVALVGLLSLNVGVMNLIPIPLFDGGRILIALIEGIRRKPLSLQVKNALMTISMIFVFALIILVTYNDVARLF